MKLPKGWLAARKEFMIGGFNNDHHIYGFDAAPLSLTTLSSRANAKRGPKIIAGAQCRECDRIMLPDRETLVEHAKLHLAVKLAKEAIARSS